MKNITYPFIQIHTAAEKIIDGDLSKTIIIDNHDEIGHVGDAFNALTSNLQEVAAYTQSTCRTIQNRLYQTTDSSYHADIKASINDLKTLNQLMQSFQLFK